jgi:hypothetical protein
VNRHVLVVLASLFIVAGARAQSVGFAGNIPVDFVVGNTTLRAGQYTITPSMSGSTLLLRRSDSTQAIFITPCLCASGNDSHETKLVFHVYGNHYFLWQIWRQSYDVGSQLPESWREMEIAHLGHPLKQEIVASLARPR